MASLVEPLACGIAGAPSGTAEFYDQGTGTLATVYADAEGVTQVTTHPLDANGGVVRYVEGRTDVVVKNVSGATVRTFTAGGDAREVRLENAGFTGTTASGATMAGGRTTVDAAFTALFASLGGTDGRALVSGVPVNISTALASSSGIFFTAKAYGAVGNGTTDDTSALQLCVNAAIAAGGGLVFVQHGTYKITSQITIPAGSNVTILGESESGTIIKQFNTGVLGWFLFGTDPGMVMNMTFTRNATAISGQMLRTSGRLTVLGCTFAAFGGAPVYADTSAGEINCYGCKFSQDESGSRIGTAGASGARLRFTNCTFFITFTLTQFDGPGGQFDCVGCTFNYSAAAGASILFTTSTVARVTGGRIDMSAVTTGTAILSAGVSLVLSGVQLDQGAGGTMQLASTGALVEAGNAYSSTGTFSIGTPTSYQSMRRQQQMGTTLTGVFPASVTPSGQVAYQAYTYSNGSVAMTVNAPTPDAAPGDYLNLLFANNGASGVAFTWNAAYGILPSGFTNLASGGTVWRFTFLRLAAANTWILVNSQNS
jgi:hypothetical protein